MSDYEIVYIKGNPNIGSKIQHENINKTIFEFIKNYSYKIIDSDFTCKESIDIIPKAVVYIAFSRGSRYLKRLPSSPMKISIAGLSASNVRRFINVNDKVQEGDLSSESLASHFIIEKEHQYKINTLIRKFLNE